MLKTRVYRNTCNISIIPVYYENVFQISRCDVQYVNFLLRLSTRSLYRMGLSARAAQDLPVQILVILVSGLNLKY